MARQTAVALAARRDRTDEHSIPNRVTRDSCTQLFDDTDGLVPDDASDLDWILAADDVEVGAADRGECDPDDRFTGSRAR
jgi:hypothetical protein